MAKSEKENREAIEAAMEKMTAVIRACDHNDPNYSDRDRDDDPIPAPARCIHCHAIINWNEEINEWEADETETLDAYWQAEREASHYDGYHSI